MMRSTVAVIALALASCSALEDQAITLCEADLQSTLKSPSSYKRIKVDSFSVPTDFGEFQRKYISPHSNEALRDTLPVLSKAKDLKISTVVISYDADNSYGAAIRETRSCTFVRADGKVVPEHLQMTAAQVNEAVAASERLLSGS